MAKIKIAQNPTFKAPVRIPRVGGDPVEVDFEFKYFDRATLATMFDRWNKARAEYAEKVKDENLSWADATGGEISLQVEQIKDVVSGWGFDDKFSEEAIARLVSTCIGAPQAVIDAYQAAYNPARLGN